LDIEVTTESLVEFFRDMFRVADHIRVLDTNPGDSSLGQHLLHGVEL
jgi:hypothetical protein